ncbi:MAG: hypothetical protein QMC89_06295 [Candidatus Hodarchaeaceae archaeon]|nr:hypothetical protein [Candidatus Hodarchaeaceae archaeon]
MNGKRVLYWLCAVWLLSISARCLQFQLEGEPVMFAPYNTFIDWLPGIILSIASLALLVGEAHCWLAGRQAAASASSLAGARVHAISESRRQGGPARGLLLVPLVCTIALTLLVCVIVYTSFADYLQKVLEGLM